MAHFFHIKPAEAEAGQRSTTRTPKERQKRTMAAASSAYLINSKSELFVTDPSRTLRQKPPGWAPPQQTL